MANIFGNTRCDGCQTLIAQTEVRAVQFYCSDYPTGDWSHVRLQNPSNWLPIPNTSMFLHTECFDIMRFASDGRQRSPAEMTCFRRAMGWRRLDLMRILPKELDIPGPRHVNRWAIARGAPRLGRLPMELIHMVRSYCPDAYFWTAVQFLDLQGFVSPGQRVIEEDLSCIVRWKRGDAEAVEGDPLGDSEYLLISLDSDGICEIQRLPKPEHPNHDPLVKLRKYVLANDQDLESVKAYF